MTKNLTWFIQKDDIYKPNWKNASFPVASSELPAVIDA